MRIDSDRVLSETENSPHLRRVTSFASLGISYPATSGERDHFLRQKTVFIATTERMKKVKADVMAATFLLGGLEPFITWNIFCPSRVDLLSTFVRFPKGKWLKGPKNSSRRAREIVLRLRRAPTKPIHLDFLNDGIVRPKALLSDGSATFAASLAVILTARLFCVLGDFESSRFCEKLV